MTWYGIRNLKIEKQSGGSGEVTVSHWTPEQIKKHLGGAGKMTEELTKEKYLELKEEGKTDKQIRHDFNLNNVRFYGLKNEWGLVKKEKTEVHKPQEVAPPSIAVKQEKRAVIARSAYDQIVDERDDLKKELEEAIRLRDGFQKQVNSLLEEVRIKDRSLESVNSGYEEVFGSYQALKAEFEEYRNSYKLPSNDNNFQALKERYDAAINFLRVHLD